MARSLVFFVVFCAGLGLDLWSKDAAFRAVPSSYAPRIPVIDGFFYIAHAKNPGAMWSQFQDFPRWVWIVLRGGVALVLAGYLARHHARFPLFVHVAFAFVLAGALGNLHDNALLDHGCVRDFLLFVFWGWPFPTFNVADSLIFCGAVLLLFYFAFLDGRRAEAKA